MSGENRAITRLDMGQIGKRASGPVVMAAGRSRLAQANTEWAVMGRVSIKRQFRNPSLTGKYTQTAPVSQRIQGRER